MRNYLKLPLKYLDRGSTLKMLETVPPLDSRDSRTELNNEVDLWAVPQLGLHFATVDVGILTL